MILFSSTNQNAPLTLTCTNAIVATEIHFKQTLRLSENSFQIKPGLTLHFNQHLLNFTKEIIDSSAHTLAFLFLAFSQQTSSKKIVNVNSKFHFYKEHKLNQVSGMFQSYYSKNCLWEVFFNLC